MISTVHQWGNSLGLRIPKAMARDLQITEGTSVDLRLEKGRLVVRPVNDPRRELEELLRQVTPENLHAEVDQGPAMGREVW